MRKGGPLESSFFLMTAPRAQARGRGWEAETLGRAFRRVDHCVQTGSCGARAWGKLRAGMQPPPGGEEQSSQPLSHRPGCAPAPPEPMLTEHRLAQALCSALTGMTSSTPSNSLVVIPIIQMGTLRPRGLKGLCKVIQLSKWQVQEGAGLSSSEDNLGEGGSGSMKMDQVGSSPMPLGICTEDLSV